MERTESPDDLALLVKAASFAARRHRDQRRKNGDIPYVNHPLAVARRLTEIGGVRDVNVLAGAILHDTVEDTAATHEELVREFGEKIAGIVAEVTDDKSLSKVERKRQQVEHARTMSSEARLVKLADKLDNLSDLATRPPSSWSLARIQGYFCWAWTVVEALGPVNEGLRRALDERFDGEIRFDGAAHPALPGDVADRPVQLDAYYASLE